MEMTTTPLYFQTLVGENREVTITLVRTCSDDGRRETTKGVNLLGGGVSSSGYYQREEINGNLEDHEVNKVRLWCKEILQEISVVTETN